MVVHVGVSGLVSRVTAVCPDEGKFLTVERGDKSVCVAVEVDVTCMESSGSADEDVCVHVIALCVHVTDCDDFLCVDVAEVVSYEVAWLFH